ncbi:hypothetical protein DICVIV_02408 [Dictyocaulus viviparus]|uniref:Uncharacterized protein n=1 Tax=Dictyocaulus viviparus TaxID=29172 RepID=A0A0D8Y5Y3_DICVI|nr:hypothetical protein DICVIV_02408 [Dictyocaulus viviparus]
MLVVVQCVVTLLTLICTTVTCFNFFRKKTDVPYGTGKSSSESSEQKTNDVYFFLFCTFDNEQNNLPGETKNPERNEKTAKFLEAGSTATNTGQPTPTITTSEKASKPPRAQLYAKSSSDFTPTQPTVQQDGIGVKNSTNTLPFTSTHTVTPAVGKNVPQLTAVKLTTPPISPTNRKANGATITMEAGTKTAKDIDWMDECSTQKLLENQINIYENVTEKETFKEQLGDIQLVKARTATITMEAGTKTAKDIDWMDECSTQKLLENQINIYENVTEKETFKEQLGDIQLVKARTGRNPEEILKRRPIAEIRTNEDVISDSKRSK